MQEKSETFTIGICYSVQHHDDVVQNSVWFYDQILVGQKFKSQYNIYFYKIFQISNWNKNL